MTFIQRYWLAFLVWIKALFAKPEAQTRTQPPVWVARAKHGKGRKANRSRWDYRR